jgi:hypothetical protein
MRRTDLTDAMAEFIESVVEDMDTERGLEEEVERIVESEVCAYLENHLSHEIECALQNCGSFEDAMADIRQEFKEAQKQAEQERSMKYRFQRWKTRQKRRFSKLSPRLKRYLIREREVKNGE